LKARLLAGADLRFGIVRGLQRWDPGIHFLPAQGVIPESLEDPDVLALAANLGRVLVSHDHETTPGYFIVSWRKRSRRG